MSRGRLARLVGRPLFWVGLLGLLFVLPIVRSVRARALLPPPLPMLGTIGDFALTDEQGQPFGSAELRGRVWVADFIFTRCPTVCPLLTEKMGRIQHRSRNLGTAFHLVSFSVDPEWDTPARLAAYARAHRASPRMWSFLTGPYETLRRTIVDGMKVSMGRTGAADDPLAIFHGSHVLLVDPAMRIRGYYDVSATEGVDTLLRDVSLLFARGE